MARTAHTGGVVCAGDRAALFSLFLFGKLTHATQPGIFAATTGARSDRAIVRVEGISRLIVASFRGRPPRAVRDIDTAGPPGGATSFGTCFAANMGELSAGSYNKESPKMNLVSPRVIGKRGLAFRGTISA